MTLTPSYTWTPTFTLTLTATPSQTVFISNTPSPTLSNSPTVSPTPTQTPDWTATPSFTAGPASPWVIKISLIDAAGLLLASWQGPNAGDLISSIVLSQVPFDPAAGPLLISSGTWQSTFSGYSAQGKRLPNGVYRLEIESSNQVTTHTYKTLISIVGDENNRISKVFVGPSPLTIGQMLWISWAPAVDAQVRIYNLNGALVAKNDLIQGGKSSVWDGKTSSGDRAAAGIYLVSLRPLGERLGRIVKIAVMP